MPKFIEAVDTRTGQKMRVPAQWPDLFDHIKPRGHHRPEKTRVTPAAEQKPQVPTLKHEPKES